jgi:integrase
MRSRGKPDDLLLVRLLVHGVLLALRPSEYADAALQGQLLIVHSRKTTNNRGLAEFRELDLAGISADEASSIDRLIEDFAKASQGELSKLLDRLCARLRRACRRLGIQPFALYTARHQAIANLKAACKSAVEIAAIAGHRSVLTQDKSYASRRSGWKHVPTIRATPQMEARLEPKAAPYVLTAPKM